jgi:hypothetical protein
MQAESSGCAPDLASAQISSSNRHIVLIQTKTLPV